MSAPFNCPDSETATPVPDPWAEAANRETRLVMRCAALQRWAQEYLTNLMTDEEAAACVAADIERVRAFRRREEVR